MDYPKFIVWNQKEESISILRVKKCMTSHELGFLFYQVCIDLTLHLGRCRANNDPALLYTYYRSISLCQTCLSRIHDICQSDYPFPSISPILLCISNMFMSYLVITKSRLYRSGFSFPKISFLHLHHYLCRSKFCVGQKIKQYECQTK